MNKLVAFCAVSIFSLAGASAFAAPVSLDAGAVAGANNPNYYEFVSTAGTSSSINKISFDYSYGTNVLPLGHAAFRIRGPGDTAALKVNIFGDMFDVDSDYGPYYNFYDPGNPASLAGTNHFEFTLNRSNGLWDLAINGSTIVFTSGSDTSAPPDGLAFSSVKKYYSDESDTAVLNAAVLGMSTALTGKPNVDCTDQRSTTLCGVGGTGNYTLQFTELTHTTGATGAFVNNIQVSSVPEPESLALVGLALAGLAITRRRRKV